MTRAWLRKLLPLAAAAAGLAAGCSGLNESRTLGSVELETLNPNRATAVPRIDFSVGGDGPSIDTLERRNWATVVDSVGFDGTQHVPTYTNGALAPRYLRETVRQRSGFPTAVSATQTFAEDGHALGLAEGIAAPFWAASDLILMLPRMIITPPWEPQLSPDAPRQRAPRGVSVATDGPNAGAQATDLAAPEPLKRRSPRRVPDPQDTRISIPQPSSAP